ncbi:hypothetical protein M8C21_027413, partial [Ambrosia artemisiifolia]
RYTLPFHAPFFIPNSILLLPPQKFPALISSPPDRCSSIPANKCSSGDSSLQAAFQTYGGGSYGGSEALFTSQGIMLVTKTMHTTDPKSFVRVPDEMFPKFYYKKDEPNKKLHSLTQMFDVTCKRTKGRTYADNYDNTTQEN